MNILLINLKFKFLFEIMNFIHSKEYIRNRIDLEKVSVLSLKRNKRKKHIYKLAGIGDTVFAPCSKDVYRKATVIDTQTKDDLVILRIQFDTGAVHFVSSTLCYKIVNGVAILLEKPTTKLQRFCIWILRQLGLSEV